MNINRRIFLIVSAAASCALAWRGSGQFDSAVGESLIAKRIVALADSLSAVSLASFGPFSGATPVETLLCEILGVKPDELSQAAALSDRELRRKIENKTTHDFRAGSVQMHAGWMIATGEAALFQLLVRHRSLS